MTATTTETGLEAHGISPRGRVIHNPTTAQLYTHALANGDGRLAHGGALVVDAHYVLPMLQLQYAMETARWRDAPTGRPYAAVAKPRERLVKSGAGMSLTSFTIPFCHLRPISCRYGSSSSRRIRKFATSESSS